MKEVINILLSQILLFLFSFIDCKLFIPNRDFNSYNINSYLFLPLDIPAYFEMPFNSSEVKKILEELKPILGYLPIIEQEILIKHESSDRLFSDSYITNLASINNDRNINPIHSEQISISEFLSKNAKRFRTGLGCIQKVSNEFKTRLSNRDDGLIENIYINNQVMIDASNQLNHCQKDFFQILFTTLNKRKEFITKITKTNYYIPDTPDYFTRNSDNTISGIKYPLRDIKNVVNSFKNYSICQQSFNSIIYRNALENIISISQMEKCNAHRVNINSGQSSKDYQKPFINYRDNEMVGINNGEGIRTDKKTQNNYLLNNGYGFGNGNNNVQLNYYYKPIIPLPKKWEERINKFKGFVSGKLMFTKPQNIQDQSTFTDLLSVILEMADEDKIASLKYLINNITLYGCNSSYIIECNSQTEPNKCSSIYNENGLDISQEVLQQIDIDFRKQYKISNNSRYAKCFLINSPYISIICNNNQFSIFSQGSNSISGDVYDYYENHESLGADIAEISQSCFGVFTSGGKNDKDACRDVINKKCATELDYRCKESGFYDIINQNPPAKTTIPKECKFTKDTNGLLKCFNYVAKYFILGNLSIRSSSFISYSLSAQIEANGGNAKVPQYYKEIFETDILSQNNDLNPYVLEDKVNPNLFFVEGNVNDFFTNEGKLNIELDETTIVQIEKADFLTINAVYLILFISLILK